MNKPLKITLISLGSLLGLVLITVMIACWFVVTPARLTSIVKKQAPNFINCDFDLEQAELTVFKSFPKVGVEIDKLVLINPMVGSPSDTLAYINECVVSVDVKKFLKEDQIIIDECRLNGGYINYFTDLQSKTNLDIFPVSEPDSLTEESQDFIYGIDLMMLKINDVSVNYTDLTQGMFAELNGLNVSAKGKMKGENIVGNVKMSLRDIAYQQTTDSLSMAVKLNDLKLEGDADMRGDDIKADIEASSSVLCYESEGQEASLNSFNIKFKGDVNDYDKIKGNAEMSVNDLSFVMDEQQLLNNADLRMILPLDATMSSMDVEIGNSQLALNNIMIDLIGKASMPGDDINIDLKLKTNTLIVEELLELVPASMREELLDGIDVKGELTLAADVEGIYNATTMPVVNAELEYNKGFVSMPEMLPYPISNLNTSIKADLNLNDKSDVYVRHLNANMSNSSLSLSGTIKDVMNKMFCNLSLKANADLDELQSFLPEDIKAKGDVKLNVAANVNKSQLDNMDFSKAKVNGSLQWDDMNVVYCDTINVDADKLYIDFTMPNAASEQLTNSLMAINIKGNNIDAKVSEMLTASLDDYNIKAQISNVLDEKTPMSVYADYSFSKIEADMEEMSFFTNNPKGSVAMFMKGNDGDASYIAVYDGDSLAFDMGETMSFATEKLDLNVSADYDDDREGLLLQWNPHAGIQMNKAVLAISDIATPVYIPSIDFQYDTTGIEIKNSRVLLGDSDFELRGRLTNVDEFLRKEALLKGSLDFISTYTDVNQIMDLFSGMGDTAVMAEEIVVVDSIATETEVKEDNPFMVPLGVNITLNTKIEKAVAGKLNLSDISGGLTVKDGVLVLQEMGFTSDAATMELTAMYKSSRKNHLFLGFDFHLLDINIDEMLDLIPELDTIVPMLSSFAGKAEFHIAAETYLKSNYEPKMSTLRGATAIHGKDLVILDNKTYKKIGRMLGFKNKEHNKIDNFNAEITVFKNEIDVYPTLITVDKYQAVVGGRHNLNMTFDYKLGLAKPWFVRRLGIRVKGDPDDMKYRFVFKKNLALEEPKGNKKDENLVKETLRLKDLIYQTLK
ncbi:MAG: hypothetical protein E7068_01705 [Lentimicrobiaceae bacterium]|nr:hypothetical protein [Lentimicrobiaceae bacterium]